jgi:hypothetical protein
MKRPPRATRSFAINAADEPVLQEAFEKAWTTLSERVVDRTDLTQDAADMLAFLVKTLAKKGTRDATSLATVACQMLDALYPIGDMD